VGNLSEATVVEYVWVFERDGERCEIRRPEQASGDAVLTVHRNGAVQSYAFRDVSSLIMFQGELEASLLGSGWSFLQFSPERRTGQDQLQRARTIERRRRWLPDPPPAG
jgi:hypothetical protein